MRLAALLLAGLALALPLAAAAGESELPSGAAAGQLLFYSYCASCHGADARGSGPVAPSLVTPPADLTRLAERYGQPLPRKALADFIDGRRDVAAHGPREMPVWGRRFFEGEAPEEAAESAKRRTLEVILDYLESIQEQRQARSPRPPR